MKSNATQDASLISLRLACRDSRLYLATLLGLLSVCISGCKTLSLPAIDPTGNRIFSNGLTTLVSPHDPNNGYPSQQPAFQAPPNPPACLHGKEGSDRKLCKGCLSGKGCLAKKKEAEEVRGRCGQLLLTPTRIVAPVGGEVILLAGVCGTDEFLVTNEPIEWMLSPKSVGEFVEVGDDAKGQRRSSWKKDTGPKVEKLGVDFARGRTSRESSIITRGTATPADDLPIRKGQTWISITSPSEGISKVTALAPDSDVWDQRRQTATIYWEDASWQFPAPQFLTGDTPGRLVTRVMRADGLIPAEGWIVRYRVLNPNLAKFLPSGAETAQVPVNADGTAVVDIAIGTQQGVQIPHGTAMVEIEVVRPARADDNIPELPLGRGTTEVTWSAPELQLNVGGPEVAMVGQPLIYSATVANVGDLNAENVILGFGIPPGMELQSTTIPPTRSTNGALAWEIGPLSPRRAFDIGITVIAKAELETAITFEATALNLQQRKTINTSIRRPTVALQIAPKQNLNQVEIGSEAVFEITVSNAGNQIVNDIAVALKSDPGLPHYRDNSNELVQNIGFLRPGENRPIVGVFRVEREGQLNVQATILSLGQVLATQTASIRGLPATPKRPSLSLQINNDSRQSAIPVGGELSLSWVLVNTGPVVLRNPVVSMQHSPNFEAIRLSQNGSYQIASQLGQWQLQDLQPNARVEMAGLFRGIAVGRQSNFIVAVQTADGIGDRQTIAVDVLNNPGGGNPGGGNPGSGEVLPSTNPSGGAPGFGGQPAGVMNKPALNPSSSLEDRLGVTIQPVSNSIRKGDVGTYEIRIENLVNKPDQRVALSLLIPQGATLKAIRAKELQYKMSNSDRQIDVEPIKYFRPNDIYSCVIELKYNEVVAGELVASVTSLGQTSPVAKSLRIQVLP